MSDQPPATKAQVVEALREARARFGEEINGLANTLDDLLDLARRLPDPGEEQPVKVQGFTIPCPHCGTVFYASVGAPAPPCRSAHEPTEEMLEAAAKMESECWQHGWADLKARIYRAMERARVAQPAADEFRTLVKQTVADSAGVLKGLEDGDSAERPTGGDE